MANKTVAKKPEKESAKEQTKERKVAKEETVKALKKEAGSKKTGGFAVIKTGGKQYMVFPGMKIKIEKIDSDEGAKVVFEDVLMREIDGKVEIGAPRISSAQVEAKVLSQTKGDKIVVFKYKKRKRYRRKQGHRQQLTEVEILNI